MIQSDFYRSAITVMTRNVIWSTTSVLSSNTEESASPHFVLCAQNCCIPCTSKNVMMTLGKNAIKMGCIVESVTLLVTRDVTTVTNAMVKSAAGWTNGLSKNVKMIKIFATTRISVVKKQNAGK